MYEYYQSFAHYTGTIVLDYGYINVLNGKRANTYLTRNDWKYSAAATETNATHKILLRPE